MIYEQDYIMRLIHEIVRALLKLFFNIDTDEAKKVKFEKDEVTKQYENLLDMIDEGKINEAENMLIGMLDRSNVTSFQMALLFYNYLNDKDDNYLEKCNYSRREISDGIISLCNQYGYGGFAELFIEDK